MSRESLRELLRTGRLIVAKKPLYVEPGDTREVGVDVGDLVNRSDWIADRLHGLLSTGRVVHVPKTYKRHRSCRKFDE